MPDLSDEAWADICAAARRTPGVEARAALSAILFDEYPAFAYNRQHVAETLKRSQRMLKHLGAFLADYRAQFPTDDDVRTEPDLWCIEALRRRAEAAWLAAHAIRRAHAGHKNVQREWLYYRLCSVWIDYFDGALVYSRPSRGGPPHGPLINFMLAAIRQVVSEDDLPGSETVRNAIDDERRGRERMQQLILRLTE
jgi:hypothetical protein